MQNLEILVWVAVLAINIVSFLFVATDKRKGVHNEPRLPEAYFFVWAIFLGALGVLAGMAVMRHKIRKPVFFFSIPAALVQNAVLLNYIFNLI